MARRYVYAVIGILVLTAIYACWCRAPMIWDGAYQFNASLITQIPYHYLSRFHSYLLWWPTVWASHYTSHVTVLQTIYGLPFLLAPVVAVGASWWILKNDAPYLIIWPIFGVAAGSLPGQIFVINDSIFQLSLFWPIFMALFVSLSMPKKAILTGLVVFQFVHQVGVVLFLGAAIAAVFLAIADSTNRKRLLVRSLMMFSLFLLAMSKLVITNTRPPDRNLLGLIFAGAGAAFFVIVAFLSFPQWWMKILSVVIGAGMVLGLHHLLKAHPVGVDRLLDTYAEHEAGMHAALNYWGSGVRGWPIRGLGCMWASAILVVLHRARQKLGRGTAQGTSAIGLYAFFFAAVGLACWVHWASDGRLWWKALDYRRWVGPLTAPFFVLAALEVLLAAKAQVEPIAKETDRPLPLREPLALLLGVTFAFVLGIQSTVWHDLSGRLFNEVMQYPASIVPESAVPWMKDTPLDHWGSADFIMALQGKNPKKLLLDPQGEANIYGKLKGDFSPRIPHWDVYPEAPKPGPGGWYDLRDLLNGLAANPHHAIHEGPEVPDKSTRPN